MTEPPVEADLVTTLFEARRDGRTGLDLTDRRLSRDAGLRLQLAVLDRYLASGDALAGWKISFTSGTARDRMGPGYRPFGYITSSRSFRSGVHIELSTMANAQLEPELCLEIAAELAGEVSPEQARSAIRSVRPSFELNEFRTVPGADDATVLADGGAQWGLVTGPGVAPREDLCGTSVTLSTGDEPICSVVPGDTMDDPYLSLARLSAMLAQYGRRLTPGQLVITGAFTKSKVSAPGVWRADFAGIGAVTVEFG